MTSTRRSTPATKAKAVELSGHSYAMDKAAFKALCLDVSKRGKALQNDVHSLLMSALAYSASVGEGGNNNATPFKQVLDALPPAIRKSDVRSWIERHSNVVIDAKAVDKKVTIHVALKALADRKVINFAKANIHPFYEEVDAKSNAELVFDDKAFAAALAKLIKRAEAANTEGKLTLSPVNQARLDSLKSMAKAAKPAAETKQDDDSAAKEQVAA